MITGLNVIPFVQAEVPSLIHFWNAGFTAARAVMTYAIERGMDAESFHSVAQTQVPLVRLIFGELHAFSRVGWKLIDDSADFSMGPDDAHALEIFRHDVAAHEAFLEGQVETTALGSQDKQNFYDRARHVYRLRPALGAMIRGICYSLVPLAGPRRIGLSSKVESTLHLADHAFDPAKGIFKNVLLNAVKYNRPGGRVEVWDEGLQVFVKDNGYGMHPNFAARLGRGEQLREKRIPDVEGNGLGWRSIGQSAWKLGWRWMIESDIDQGTLVRFTINSADLFTPLHAAVTGEYAKLGGGSVRAADIARRMNLFEGAELFQGYRLVQGKGFDVTASPIFTSIGLARELIELLTPSQMVHNDSDSME